MNPVESFFASKHVTTCGGVLRFGSWHGLVGQQCRRHELTVSAASGALRVGGEDCAADGSTHPGMRCMRLLQGARDALHPDIPKHFVPGGTTLHQIAESLVRGDTSVVPPELSGSSCQIRVGGCPVRPCSGPPNGLTGHGTDSPRLVW
ncbi:hypothetical protein NUM_61810 [Actinocatenispora comari]|uniref:Uncharacterized protein n=1 Tax=Actinocatenispora comari TaxID=2807577 RepID=A0A8J4AJK7_9ACTN|nr:hypothetical protein NUM_61810 [Actinocatenispora comari]